MSQVALQKESGVNVKYFLLYIPFLISLLLSGNSIACYLISWLGSFYIFFISFTNKVKPTSPELPLAEKIFKPLFLTQIIFAGYMSCTSIFYFLQELGYENFEKIYGAVVSPYELSNIAKCQQYYILGHAALSHSMLYFYKSNNISNFYVHISNWPKFFIKVALICSPLGYVFSKIGGLSVLGNSLEGLGLVAGTISLALSIPLRNTGMLIVSGIIYFLQLFQTLTSGFKEPVIVSILMLGLFLYPFYKKTITIVFLPLLFVLFAVLPTYVNSFRSSISNSNDSETAKAEALEKVREGLAGENLAQTNWAFLTDRISEIGMFTKYKESTEDRGNFYGFQIVGQSVVALVPRLIWPSKPITEEMAMVRVIENGIVSEHSEVSAKPQYIVDCYLSAGLFGIWLGLFFYGFVAQYVSNLSERLFGGYFFGTVFIYTGMFRSLWRGNCFEFIFNNMFYSIIGLFLLFLLFRQMKILVSK